MFPLAVVGDNLRAFRRRRSLARCDFRAKLGHLDRWKPSDPTKVSCVDYLRRSYVRIAWPSQIPLLSMRQDAM